MADHNLGTIRGTIQIDYDGAGIVRAIKDTDKAKDRMSTLEGASDKVLGAFGKFGQGALKVAAAVNLASNAGGLLVHTIGILGPILAAGLSTAPAIILGFASALVIAKVAVSGVGDAMKAAGEGGDKFDKAMKKLSPEAQNFVKAYQKTIPVLNGVKNAIQDAFFKNTAGAVKGVVSAVASLKPQAAGVSGALGFIVKDIVKFATSGKSIEGLRQILSGVTAFLLRMRGAIGPVVQAFIQLGAQASGFGGVVGGTLANALKAFAGFLKGIDIKALFEGAIPIIKSLAGTLANIGSIVSSVFGGITSDGSGAATILQVITGELAAFLKSAEGQSALAALGTALQAISTGAGQVFLALLNAIAPAIVALAPGITILAGQLTGALLAAINFLNPALQALAGFLSDNMGWVGPLAGAVLGLAAAYKVYATISGIVDTIKGLELIKLAQSTAAWIANTAAAVGNGVAVAASAVAGAAVATVAWIANTAAVIANGVAMAAQVVAMVAVKAATIAWTAVQWLLNAALTANPVGLIIVGIAALIAVIVLIATKTTWFQTIWHVVWGGIQAAAAAVASWFMGTIVPSFVAAFNQLRAVLSAIGNFFKSIWNGIKAATTAVFSFIVSYVRAQIAGVRAAIAGVAAVVGIVRNAFNNAKNAVSSAIGGVVSLVRSLPGKVASALGNLGSLLYSKGRSLVQGFISGIASMIGAVAAKAKSVVSAVTKFLPGSPAKEGPLSGRGYVLLRARRMMADFAQGIDDGAVRPAAAMMGAVVPMSRAIAPGGSGTTSGSSSAAPVATPAVSGQRSYSIAIGDKTFATLVVDALTGAPVEVSKAANEGARQNAWSGSGRQGR